MKSPAVRKAKFIRGKSLGFRDACVQDAAFILALRTNEQKSRHLSKVSADLQNQKDWLLAYQARKNEAYFVIENLERDKLGMVRIYDAQGESFCWGSWILSNDAPSTAAIESALMVYAYAMGTLGFSMAHFQVNKANERVWKFHERFGAIRRAEDADQFHYVLSGQAIAVSMKRYERYLPTGIVVEELDA